MIFDLLNNFSQFNNNSHHASHRYPYVCTFTSYSYQPLNSLTLCRCQICYIPSCHRSPVSVRGVFRNFTDLHHTNCGLFRHHYPSLTLAITPQVQSGEASQQLYQYQWSVSHCSLFGHHYPWLTLLPYTSPSLPKFSDGGVPTTVPIEKTRVCVTNILVCFFITIHHFVSFLTTWHHSS